MHVGHNEADRVEELGHLVGHHTVELAGNAVGIAERTVGVVEERCDLLVGEVVLEDGDDRIQIGEQRVEARHEGRREAFNHAGFDRRGDGVADGIDVSRFACGDTELEGFTADEAVGHEGNGSTYGQLDVGVRREIDGKRFLAGEVVLDAVDDAHFVAFDVDWTLLHEAVHCIEHGHIGVGLMENVDALEVVEPEIKKGQGDDGQHGHTYFFEVFHNSNDSGLLFFDFAGFFYGNLLVAEEGHDEAVFELGAELGLDVGNGLIVGILAVGVLIEFAHFGVLAVFEALEGRVARLDRSGGGEDLAFADGDRGVALDDAGELIAEGLDAEFLVQYLFLLRTYSANVHYVLIQYVCQCSSSSLKI